MPVLRLSRPHERIRVETHAHCGVESKRVRDRHPPTSVEPETSTARPDGNHQAGGARPGLVFFYDTSSGRCRRVEGFLAQVLQRRRNHGTFKMYRVERDDRPDLIERFGIEAVPALAVLGGKRVLATMEDPRGCQDIERFLAPWLK